MKHNQKVILTEVHVIWIKINQTNKDFRTGTGKTQRKLQKALAILMDCHVIH